MATTLKLPPELKERIGKVVKDTGQTAHAFMIDAIRRQTENAEKRREFVAAAHAAREEFERTGLGYDWKEVRAYYRAKGTRQESAEAKAEVVARITILPPAEADLARLAVFLLDNDPGAALETYDLIVSAIDMLALHPLLGRSGEHGYRELAISRGKSGYLALYDYLEADDLVLVFAIRHQREAGFTDPSVTD